jgi:integrase
MSPQRRRRSQGEGSVFRRSDGKWRGVLDLGWTDGRRTRRWVFGATEREVLAKLAELREAQRRGQNLSARRYTFGQWLEEWLSVKRRQGTRASTLRGYEWLIRQHIRPGLGGIRLDKLTPTDIRHLVERKAESGLSAQSVRLMHALIRNALADAEREELVHRNVAKQVRPPVTQREEVRVLTVEDARRLVGVIRGDRFEALWVCALTLGLRKGELLGLRWSDIDFGDATLTVRQALQRVGGHLVLVEPKTARSRRVVPVPPPTLAALCGHRRRQKADQLAAGPAWRDTDLVFATHLGGPLEPRNVNRSWYAIRSRAGLTGFRLHDLRHSCASFMLAAGASPRTVMKTLGHSQIGLTMNTYTHVLPEIERAAIDAAARVIFE